MLLLFCKNQKKDQTVKKNIWIEIVCVVLVIALVVSAGAHLIMHSPKYTFYKITKALENHDWETFTEYVDIDAVYTSAMSDVGEETTLASGIANVMTGAMKETIIAQIKAQVENPNNNIHESPLLSIFDSEQSVKPKIETISSGKISTVKITSKHGVLDIPAYVEVQLRSEGWKYVVVGFNLKNIEHRKEIVDESLKKYTVFPLKKKFFAAATINFTKVRKSCAESFYGTCFEDLIMIDRTVHNHTEKKIKTIEYYICPNDYKTKDVCRFTSDKNIKPGETKEVDKNVGWKYNKFIDDESAILKYNADQLVVVPDEIRFEDNDSIIVDEYAYMVMPKLPTLDEISKFLIDNKLEYGDSIKLWTEELK